jgi:hypothetical protein
MLDTIFVLGLVAIKLVSSSQRTVVVSFAAFGKLIKKTPKIQPCRTPFLTTLAFIFSKSTYGVFH